VLNTQRAKVYEQRNRIFTKDDLSEDVTEMLQTEVNRRVPEALDDPDGPWKLLAWLEQIQPPLQVNGFIYPSYTLRLILDHILGGQTNDEGRTTQDGNLQPMQIERDIALKALLEVADESLKAEEEHALHSIANLLELSQERFQTQLEERLETVDTFFEGLDLEEEGDGRSPRQLVDELSGLVRVPLKLSNDEQRALKQDPEQVAEIVRAQVSNVLVDQAITRLIGAAERRLEEDLDLNRAQLPAQDWEALSQAVLDAIQSGFGKRRQRLVGENGDGSIAKDLETALARAEGPLSEMQLLSLLMQLPQGSRAMFDKRTHRRVWRRTTRLTYFYAAAHFMQSRTPEQITAEVLEHLENAQAAMRSAWGRSEWSRLATARPLDLDGTTRRGIQRLLGEERYAEIAEGPLQTLQGEERLRVVDELGRQALTEVYRQLLLGVISELWVEYLTNMEALRVSIGLEAMLRSARQYKQAFEMFRIAR
jgi:preprotein translocase subunit SecA